MKLSTHSIFSSGLVFFLSFRLFSLDLYTSLLLSTLSAVMQYTIDFASHESREGIVRRTPLFHSITGALLISAIFVLLFHVVVKNVAVIVPGAIACVVSSLSHLFLDFFTEKGIYINRRRTAKRRMISSRDPAINILFTLIGIVLWISSLYG